MYSRHKSHSHAVTSNMEFASFLIHISCDYSENLKTHIRYLHISQFLVWKNDYVTKGVGFFRIFSIRHREPCVKLVGSAYGCYTDSAFVS